VWAIAEGRRVAKSVHAWLSEKGERNTRTEVAASASVG